jgi:hypothetical protein
MKKVIIWGHKGNGHTHSYIHSSYYRAFKYLGFDTYWFEDGEDVSGFNFENSIFFTEDQVQKNIPLIKSSKYILHHTKLDKYIENNLSYINLGNYLKWCDDGISAYHKENSVEKINDVCFWDDKTKTIYQPWGTNLLPSEINLENAKSNVNSNTINYIGMKHDNFNEIDQFETSSIKHNLNFNIVRGVSDSDAQKMIDVSLMSVDLRGPWHKECGYLPCRVFKNNSYGRITGTNSENVKKIFGDYVVYDENPNSLFDKLMYNEKNTSLSLIKESMLFIKEKHTFINRINNLISVLQ